MMIMLKKVPRKKRHSSLKSIKGISDEEYEVKEKKRSNIELAKTPLNKDLVKETPKSTIKDKKLEYFRQFNRETSEQFISTTPIRADNSLQRVKKLGSSSELEHVEETPPKKPSLESQIDSLFA